MFDCLAHSRVGTIGRCGLTERGVALLEVRHYVGGLWDSYGQAPQCGRAPPSSLQKRISWRILKTLKTIVSYLNIVLFAQFSSYLGKKQAEEVKFGSSLVSIWKASALFITDLLWAPGSWILLLYRCNTLYQVSTNISVNVESLARHSAFNSHPHVWLLFWKEQTFFFL